MTRNKVYRIVKRNSMITRKGILEKLGSDDMEVLKAILYNLRESGKIELTAAIDDNGKFHGCGYRKARRNV